MSNEQFLDYMSIGGTMFALAIFVYFTWPRYGYTAYPQGKHRLEHDDYTVGFFGIMMKLGTFRAFGYLYALVTAGLAIAIQFVPPIPT